MIWNGGFPMDENSHLLMEAFRFRHACKAFDPTRRVSDEDFAMILEAGRLSPSSFGLEPWKFVVLQNREIREKLRPAAWGARNSFDGASHFVVLLARRRIDSSWDSDYVSAILTEVQKLPPDVAEQRRARIEVFQKSDFRLTESDRAFFDWACRQTYLALANMLTTAAFLKVDSCPIEGFDREEAERVLSAEGVLDAEHFGVSVMAGFGYRAKEPRPKTRRPAEDVVQWVT